MSAEVSEVALLLKFAFREKAVAPLAEAPGFREFPMRDLNFALFLRPSGYEPDELPLLHPATLMIHLI